jgi:putative flavoprotein involved in K+ transport
VLIVGSGQTGVQLAEELAAAGRAVYISVGSAGRIPRRYRGRDIFGWLADILRHGAAYDVRLPTAEKLPDPRRRFNPMPALSGHGGGHDTNLRRYAAAGMTLAGHLTGADGERLTFAHDLAASLAAADRFFDERFRAIIDGYVERAGIAAPPDDRVESIHERVGRTKLHLLREGISTIVWATGYRLDHRWIDAPIFDAFGYPRNVRGVTAVPGLYFLGLLWQHSQASASLLAPELDGPYLVKRMRQGRRAAAVTIVS